MFANNYSVQSKRRMKICGSSRVQERRESLKKRNKDISNVYFFFFLSLLGVFGFKFDTFSPLLSYSISILSVRLMTVNITLYSSDFSL